MEKPTTYRNVVGLCCLRNIKKQTNDLYLVHCGQQSCPSRYTYNHKHRNEFHLHFILNGKGILHINKKIYFLEKGDIFVLPPNIISHYHADDENPWEYIWVTFNGTNARTYLEYAGITDNNPVIRSAIPTSQYLPLVKKILGANELTYANELKRVGYLFEILAKLIDAQQSANGPIERRYEYSSETYIKHALEYITNNYDHIKINDIANFIGINRSYLTNIFKKKLDISPQKYLVQYRLEKAEELIRTTNLSIKDIASHIGYQDSLNFSKMFKKTYGVSPKYYRLTHTNNASDDITMTEPKQ